MMDHGSDNASLGRNLRSRLPRLRWALRKLIGRNPPKGDVYYGDMAALYDEERARSKRWHREQTAVETCLRGLPEALRVLDVPVGTGRFLAAYAARGHDVTGLDASEEMLSVARQRGAENGTRLRLVKGDATQLPYDDGAFELVVSTRFLRHVLPFEQAKRALAEMARVCSGHAIIEMGSRSRATRWPSAGKPIRDAISHDDLTALFVGAGFEVLDFTPTTRNYIRFGRGRRRAVYLLRRAGGDG